jgi:hypothetical protein
MSNRGRPLTPPANVAGTWFRPAQRAQTLIGSTADQRLEAEPNGVSVGSDTRRRLRFAKELLVDVQRLFHTYDYAISVWHPCSAIPRCRNVEEAVLQAIIR